MGTPRAYQAYDCNHEFTLFASAARTASANSTDLENRAAKGIHIVLDVTAASGTTPTLDVKIQRKCPLSDKYVDVPGAAFSQKTATGTDDLVIYPGITAAANRAVSNVISSRFRAVATIAGTTPSFTFTLAGSFVV